MKDCIKKTIELKAPVERVWRALTDYTEFGIWFRVKLEEPFVPGKTSRGYLTYPGYEHLAWEAKIREMQAPHYFAFTWHPYAVDPDINYSDEMPTLVEFRLESILGGTRLTVTESGFDKLPPNRKPDALRMNDNGWSTQMNNIQTHVES